MKRIFLMTAALTATMFASCDKTGNPGDDPIEGKAAKLNIEIATPALSKAAYTTTPPTDAITNYSVFVTDQSDEIRWKQHINSGSNVSDMSVTTMAKHVYVVANHGSDLTRSVATMAQLNAVIADLNGPATSNGAQTEARWASGNTTTPLSFTRSGSTFSAGAVVPLEFIATRITVKIVNSMSPAYDAAKTDGSLVLNRVSVLNARGQSKLFGTSLIPGTYTAGKKFYEGMANPSPTGFAYYPAAADYTMASTGRLSDAIPANDFATQYVYYVFENDADQAAEFPTIVVLEGTFDGAPVYYPVHLTPYEQWSSVNGGPVNPSIVGNITVTRSKSLDIVITLTGDPTHGGDGPGGMSDPTKPVEVNAQVDIAIGLLPWQPVTLGKEF
ncbi:MAG: hypothetical protein LBV32_01605 [Tannerellaceae bacterium]|jgi:hypothetical protein|nr:hypothetical protein [Tannerellaceae bacterium]